MKREIKFRAWQPQVKRMFEVGDIDFIKEEVMLRQWGWESSNDIDLMQYTGLKDNNGREIYGGDIVRTGEDNIGDPDPMIGQVIMREGSWLIENEKKQEAMELFSEITSREVIGNIFENPELLEGKQ
ncbi:YopX family protein [uncultured Lacticaseibacillus sp.]|uniref:YopX family protein n=1 Tax=uncultured Lacticaseibacillus sp. TaxID=2775882 RepID=UPI00258C291B|nr:YopX family protein [uncultured Lacticaseibacillus sp.]